MTFALPAFAGAVLLAGRPALAGDFNGDGIDDLAIGAPGDTVLGAASAGSVNIVYGGGMGFGLHVAMPLPAALLFQDPLGGVSLAGDMFGFALAIGDFNGDGYDDLAMGAPNDDFSGAGAGEGMVIVVYGDFDGLGVTPPLPAWAFGQAMVGGPFTAGEFFGFALAAGDFDGDGMDDLAIGVANHDALGLVDVGAFYVLPGSAIGLSPAGAQYWRQDFMGEPAEAGDHFGVALVSGDFDCNGADDLVIGADGEDVAVVDEGAAIAIHGLVGVGLNPASAWFFHQGLVGGGAEVADHFGRALATGDFDDNGAMDVAVGIPDEDIGVNADTGQVAVVYSLCGVGLGTAILPQRWHQNSANVPEANGPSDHFGSALGAGDFDGNLADDLAIGQPGEDVGAALQAGGVTILYGDPAAGGLVATAAAPYLAQFWHQNSALFPEANATNDNQGSSLAVGDFDADTLMDLAIGVPGEDVGANVNAGYVNTVYGTATFAFGGLSSLAPVAPQGFRRGGGILPGGLAPGDSVGAAVTSNR